MRKKAVITPICKLEGIDFIEAYYELYASHHYHILYRKNFSNNRSIEKTMDYKEWSTINYKFGNRLFSKPIYIKNDRFAINLFGNKYLYKIERGKYIYYVIGSRGQIKFRYLYHGETGIQECDYVGKEFIPLTKKGLKRIKPYILNQLI